MSLPGPALAALLHPHTGDLADVQPTSRGFSSDLTALVTGEDKAWFVKVVANRPGGRRDSLVREGTINPHVQPIAPAVRWRAENSEWLALGFDVVDGRHADFEPGSPDLPAVVDVLNRIAAVPLPDVAADWPETRWDRHTDRPDLFRGDALLYTDIHPSNILIGDKAVWAVDWAWPTRGAAFIDPAVLALQLVAAGHTPDAAEAWAAGCPAWTSADATAVTEFAAANARMYEQLADRRPDASWLREMASAAQHWATYRRGHAGDAAHRTADRCH